jgi:hypothetical protein
MQGRIPEHEDLAVINRKIEFSKRYNKQFAQYGKITEGTKTEDILQKATKVTKGVSAWIRLSIRQLFVCFVRFCKNFSVFVPFAIFPYCAKSNWATRSIHATPFGPWPTHQSVQGAR